MRLRIRIDGEAHEVVLEKGRVVVDGQAYPARVEGGGPGFAVRLGRRRLAVRVTEGGLEVDGEPLDVHVQTLAPAEARAQPAAAGGPVHPPLPGRIAAVRVKPGEAVKAGQCLVVVEAMKMQNEVPAPADATVREVRVKEGQLVEPKDVLVVLG